MPTPAQPIVNGGLLYMNGFNLSWLTTTTLSVTGGQCRDSTNTNDIQYIGQLNQYNQSGMVQTLSSGTVQFANPVIANLPATITINGAVNGLNGLDTGALAASTFYAVYAVADSYSNNPTGAMVSLSATAPTLPVGYDMFRRIGFVLTDGASHFLPFWQATNVNGSNRTMYYDALISITTTNKAAFFTQTLAAAVPDAVGQTIVILNISLTPAVAGDTISFRPTGSTSTNGDVIMSGDAAAVAHRDNVNVLAAVNSATGHVSIDYVNSNAGDTFDIFVAGYVDNL